MAHACGIERSPLSRVAKRPTVREAERGIGVLRGGPAPCAIHRLLDDLDIMTQCRLSNPDQTVILIQSARNELLNHFLQHIRCQFLHVETRKTNGLERTKATIGSYAYHGNTHTGKGDRRMNSAADAYHCPSDKLPILSHISGKYSCDRRI